MAQVSKHVAVAAIWLCLMALAPLAHGSVCGDGIIEGGEECDPGGPLFCNGDPSASSCTTGAQCPGSVNCYFAFGCCKFNCQFVGQGADCFDGNTCTDGDHCDNVGRCIGQFKADGTACDDGLFCNGADQCMTGECDQHAGDPCIASTDCLATCNETSNACESTPFVPCGDDGNTCTDDVCNGSGTCTHPALPGGTVCRPVATGCDVQETCPGGGAPCPADAFLPDNTSCGDACTTNGTCQTGQCVNGVPLDCDDDDVCNGLETCDPITGCVAGTPLDCVDGLPCTDDLCDPIGGCSNPQLPDGAPCDDGLFCTLIDVCNGGVCEGTTPSFLGRISLRLGSASETTGHAAVNDPGGAAKLTRGAIMTTGSLLTADIAKLGRLTSVFDLEVNQLRNQGQILGTQSTASLPVVPTFCDFPAITCGSTPVIVPDSSVVLITPGSYGAVSINRRGTLELDPGDYDFCGLRAKGPAAIRAKGNVKIRIQGDFRTSKLALLEPYAGSTQILVQGKAKFGQNSEIHQTAFRVPFGTMTVGPTVRFDGAICADRLRVNRGARIGCPLP